MTQDTEVDHDCTDTVITCPTQEVALTDTELDVRAMATAASQDTTGTHHRIKRVTPLLLEVLKSLTFIAVTR